MKRDIVQSYITNASGKGKETKMAILLRSVYFVLSGSFIVVAGNDLLQSGSVSPSRDQQRLPDPVRNFFSELGDLFLTVDRTMSTQTAPKTNFADALKEQIYLRLRRPDHDYFERIQENYKDLQKRVLSTVTRAAGDESLSGKLGIQNNNEKNFVDVRLPFLPLRLTSSRKPPATSESDDNDVPEIIPSTEDVSKQDFDSVINVASSTLTIKSQDSKAKAAVPQMSPLEIAWKDFQKRMESVPVNQRSKIFPTEDEMKIAINRFFKDVPQSQEILNALRERGVNVLSVSRSGDLMEEAQINQASFEDNQSESAFDNYVEQLLENQAKWFLDSDLKRKNATKQSQEQAETPATQDSISNTEIDSYTEETTTDDSVWRTMTDFNSDVTTEIPTTEPFLQDMNVRATSRSPRASGNNFLPDNYYETDKNSEVEYVVDPESFTELSQEFITDVYQENEPRGSLLLAFTPDGVPLKLRIGAEIENPIEFLHELLTVAGVSINIPIASFDTVEPVGSEVLQLGAGDGQTMSRALYIDITDNDEFKSLVESLRLSKTLKESIAR